MAAAGTRFGFGALAPFKMPDGATRLVPVFYWKGEPYPVILPSVRDPRLHFAAIIWGLQIMGQVWLRFETTPALIISTIFVAAIFEIYLFAETQKVIQFPSSAMQAANSLTWFVKTNGTRWGDWFSMNGFGFLWLGAFIAIGQKYIIKLRGEQGFNPSAADVGRLRGRAALPGPLPGHRCVLRAAVLSPDPDSLHLPGGVRPRRVRDVADRDRRTRRGRPGGGAVLAPPCGLSGGRCVL